MHPAFPARFLALSLACACFGPVCGVAAGAKNVVAAMERVADWQLAHPADVPATDWVQAAGDDGIMALAGVAESPRYAAALTAMAEANRWQLGPRTYMADDLSIGQTYADLYRLQPDPARIAPLLHRLDLIMAHPRDGSLEFDRERNPGRLDRWSWCDALFMAPPAWARAAAITGRRQYLDYMIPRWWATSDFLCDRTEGLFFRDSTYFNRREPNGRKVFWSRGNGWVLAGLVRVLQELPAGLPARCRFVSQYRELARRVLSLQPADGMWRSSLLDPADYPVPEASGTGLFCYAFAWGVNQGILDPERFGPAAERAWRGLVGCVEPDGKLTHVQPVGAQPRRFDPESTEPYGVGAFLLAGSEIFRLERRSAPAANRQ